jgi:hypothetical protein
LHCGLFEIVMAKPTLRLDPEKVKDNLRDLAGGMPRLLAQAVNHRAQIVLGNAVEITPREHGTLWRSAKVNPDAKPDNLQATITYGTDYAVFVHETPPPPGKSMGGRSARHFPPFGKGGQWKFLETPLKTEGSAFSQNIAKYVKKRLARIT